MVNAWCEVVCLQSRRERRVGRKTRDVGNPWVELLVSIYDLLHNRSRPVSRNGEISAAKMGRWCGKTWLEFAPRRSRATASSGRTTCLALSCLGIYQTRRICCVHTDKKASAALIVIRCSRSFNFSCRDCVTVLQVRHTTYPRYLAGVSSS